MTKQEIIIFNELIKQTVKSVVKETIREELENVNKSNKKDLREVKLLLAKIIKEGAGTAIAPSNFLQMAENLQETQGKRNMNDFQATLQEAMKAKGKNMPGGLQYVPKQSNLPMVQDEDALPSNFDAPIPVFSKGDFSLD